MSLGLGELFDLEALLLREKNESEEVRRARYRVLGRKAIERGVSPENAAGLLRTLVRTDGSPTPGSRFEAAVGWFHTLLSFAALGVGFFVAVGLFITGGAHPVNVLHVLAVVVGLQVVLLLLLLIALIPRTRSGPPSLVHELLLRGLQALVTRAMPETDPQLVRTIVGRLNAHMGLTRWLLLRSAQVFGVFFNLALLTGFLVRIVFTDIAFGWSTTLHLDAPEIRRLLKIVSSPWSWFFPKAVPTEEMIRLTQYSHLEGNYVVHAAGTRSLSPAMLGGWWRFLVLSAVTYGFLPRLLVLTLAEFRVRRILTDTPERNEELRRLADWMKLPLVTTSADGTPVAPPAAAGGSSTPEPELPPSGTTCEVVVDGTLGRDAVDRALRERFGWTAAAQPSTDLPLVVVLSAWEEPTKGNQRRFQNLSPERLVVLGLFNPSPDGSDDPRLARIRDRWKRHLAGLRCRVEAMG